MFLIYFDPSATFFYRLKPSENLKVFWCFQGLGEKWLRVGFKFKFLKSIDVYIVWFFNMT